ncbi:hypothetical protein [Amycolatopsis sp. cmx-11-12]|uniref:hypothetical protein n=1 Tax=Amycolatopsis sp. cmx-11-12 TaxID=2785795 RepID=UPI0039184F43
MTPRSTPGFVLKLALTFAAIFLGLSGQTALASAPPASTQGSETVACENWINVFNPVRIGRNIAASGDFRNCGGYSRVCIEVDYFHIIFPSGGTWVPLGTKCDSDSSGYLTGIFAEGEVSYAQAYAWITAFDHSGRPVWTKKSAVVAV